MHFCGNFIDENFINQYFKKVLCMKTPKKLHVPIVSGGYGLPQALGLA